MQSATCLEIKIEGGEYVRTGTMKGYRVSLGNCDIFEYIILLCYREIYVLIKKVVPRVLVKK